jgi:hypothetical protein
MLILSIEIMIGGPNQYDTQVSPSSTVLFIPHINDSSGNCRSPLTRNLNFVIWLILRSDAPPHLLGRTIPSSSSGLLLNGFATSLVARLHLRPDILCSTGIYMPQTQLPENEETAFRCAGKGQGRLEGKQAS